MTSLIDVSAWRAAIAQAAGDLMASGVAFVPKLLGAVLVLLAGVLISRLSEAITGRALRAMGINRAARHLGIADAMERAGIPMAPSDVFARIMFWLLLFTFTMTSVDILGLSALAQALDRVVAYVPSLFGAGLTLFLGMLLARFMGGLAASAAVAAGSPQASHLALATKLVITGLVAVLALEQLGVQTSVLVAPLTALLTTAGLAAGLAFALGARPIVTHILAGHYLRQTLPRDATVEIGGQRGVVQRVGATDTLFRSGEESWSVPNATLIDAVITR